MPPARPGNARPLPSPCPAHLLAWLHQHALLPLHNSRRPTAPPAPPRVPPQGGGWQRTDGAMTAFPSRAKRWETAEAAGTGAGVTREERLVGCLATTNPMGAPAWMGARGELEMGWGGSKQTPLSPVSSLAPSPTEILPKPQRATVLSRLSRPYPTSQLRREESAASQLAGPLAPPGASGGRWKVHGKLNPRPHGVSFRSQIAQRQLGCRRFNIPSQLPALITVTRDCSNVPRNVQALQRSVPTGDEAPRRDLGGKARPLHPAARPGAMEAAARDALAGKNGRAEI